MKKFKTFSMTAISLLLCGTLCLSACGKGGKEEAKKADEETKTEVIGNVTGSFEDILTDGKTYKITLAADMAIETIDDVEAAAGSAGTWSSGTMDVDGTAYFQYTTGENAAINVDAILDGEMISPESASDADAVPYIYAAAYVRTDTVYAGTVTGKTAPTDEQKKNVELFPMAIEDIMGMIQGDSGSDEAVPMNATQGGADEGGSMEDMVAGIMSNPAVMALMEKVLMNVIVSIPATQTKKGDVTTLTFDLKAELDYIYNTAKKIIEGIKAETKLGDLLDSAELKAFVTPFLKGVTAAEVKGVVDAIMGEGAPAPTEGQSAYDYIVTIAKAAFAEQLTMPIGSTDIKSMIDQTMNGLKLDLDAMKVLEISMSVKNDVFYGFGVEVEFDSAIVKVDLSFSVTMEAVEYTFADVTKMNVNDGSAQQAA